MERDDAAQPGDETRVTWAGEVDDADTLGETGAGAAGEDLSEARVPPDFDPADL